jgi:hypothetical protein
MGTMPLRYEPPFTKEWTPFLAGLLTLMEITPFVFVLTRLVRQYRLRKALFASEQQLQEPTSDSAS